MKDIQEKLISKLEEIEDVEVVSYVPPNFNNLENTTIVVQEISNTPSMYFDNKELISQIIYNIDIYMNKPQTHIIRNIINQKMVELGFVREASSGEGRNKEVYFRLLTYKIKL